MIRKIGRWAGVTVAAAALAASGTALFGATALAHGKGGGQHGSNHVTGGSGGKGGTAQAWCLIPIAGGLGILGSGSAQDNSQCNASTSGGSGAPGASY